MKYQVAYNSMYDATDYEYLIVEAPKGDVEAIYDQLWRYRFGDWFHPDNPMFDEDYAYFHGPSGMCLSLESIFIQPAPPNALVGSYSTDGTYDHTRYRRGL